MKDNIIQVRNPKTRKYVKINKTRKRIVSQRSTPYKGIPVKKASRR